MWRGPTWPILNWFVMQGLMKHGYRNISDQLLDRWIELYKLSGVWEQYNPITGEKNWCRRTGNVNIDCRLVISIRSSKKGVGNRDTNKNTN